MWLHFWLLGLVAILTGGILLYYRLLQIRRTFNPAWGRPLLACVLFYTADFLFSFLLHYNAINVNRLPFGHFSPLAHWLITFFPFLFSFFYFFYLLKTIDSFLSPPHPALIRGLTLAIAALFLLDEAVHTLGTLPAARGGATFIVASLSLASMNPIVLVFLIVLLRKKQETLLSPTIARPLAFILLFRQILNQLSSIWSYLSVYVWQVPSTYSTSRVIHTFYIALTYLLIFLWLHRFALPFLKSDQTRQMQEDHLSAFFNRHDLSQREEAVVRGIARGQSNKEVAADLGLSPSTIKNHLYRIYQKLGISTSFELLDLIQASKTPSRSECVPPDSL